MRFGISMLGLVAVTCGCGGKSDLFSMEAAGGTGGTSSGGTSGNAGEGVGGSAGEGGSGGGSAGGSSGTGGTGVAGSGGTGAPCTTHNPAGCIQTGCMVGYACDVFSEVCKSSSCTCDSELDTWVCDPDCGGGVCVPDTSGAIYFVRIGYVQGQETTGDFCVAYGTDEMGGPVWDPVGLPGIAGIEVEDFEGMDKLSRYIPLKAAPVALGKSYGGCAEPGTYVNGVFVPPGSTHYTLLSVPYSFEPDYVWVVADPGGAASVPGIRVVNALWDSVPIEVAADGHALGELEWANAPTSYLDISPFTGSDHLNQVVISDTSFALSRTLSWASWDLVSMASVTIYLSGALEFYPATGLACFDSQPDTGGPLSNCWPVESP